MHATAEATAFVEAFVAEPFSHDPRHQRRIDLLAEYEATGVLPPLPSPPPAAPARPAGGE